MFLWRNILSALCWVFCSASLFAQNIDYSKCSCDSLFQKVFKKEENYLKDYSDYYKGKRRYIENNKCIIASDADSIIIRYKKETLWDSERDSTEIVKSLHTIKTDSTVFHKKKNNHFSEVELYQRKVSDLEIEYNFFKKDFGLELRLKVFKSITGKDSAFTYISEKSFTPVYEYRSNFRQISMVFASGLPIKHTFSIDTNGNLHGRYIAYCPSGEKMTVQTFSHGIKNGYFYYATACRLMEDEHGEKLKKGKYFSKYYNNKSTGFEYEKGYYNNGVRTGKWLQRLEFESVFVNTGIKYKRYVIKYGKNDKVYLRRFLVYKQLTDNYISQLCCSDSDLRDVISHINDLYRYRISDLTGYKSEYEKMNSPNYRIIKIVEK